MNELTQFVFFLSTAEEASSCLLLDEPTQHSIGPSHTCHIAPGTYKVLRGSLVLLGDYTAINSEEAEENPEDWATAAKRGRANWLLENPY